MADRLPAPVRRFTDGFKAFTPGQKAVTIAAVLALIIGGYFFAVWASKPSYSILFNNLSTKDASAIVQSLEKSGASYELSNNGQTILVPKDKVDSLRLALSGEGLPGDADTGYALLDQQGITTSDFMQHVDYQRAMEGELASTIKSIDGVEAATVHLVMPQKDVFADDQDQTTASVLVASSPAKPLTTQQVQAIVHLVASSVEGLDPTQVTVAGADGRILSTGGGAAVATGGDSGADSQTVAFQNRLNTSVQNMLDSVVGPGHAVVTTTAQLNYDQVQTTNETYKADPSLPALSESISREAYNGNGNGNGGVLGPDNIQVPSGTSGTSGTGQYENSNRVTNSALDKLTQVSQQAPGKIDRLSMSVLLDSTTAGAVDSAQVQQLVSAAAGIDPTRGDTVAVAAMPFDTSAAQAAKNALAAATNAESSARRMSLLKTAVLVLIVLFLIFLAWRASRARKRRTLSPTELGHLEDMQAALEQQRLGEMNRSIPQPGMDLAANREEQARDERQREIEQMVEDQPEEMAALLRGWLGASR